MEIQKILQNLRNGEIQPVYLIIGTESFLAHSYKEEIAKRVLSEEERELNLASFDMEEIPLSLALEEANSMPFFGDYRLVFIENPYFLTAEKKNKGPEHNVDELLAYVKNPVNSSVVVITAPYEKLDERKKITKSLKKVAEVLPAEPLNEKDLTRYLHEKLKSQAFHMSKDAQALFIQLTDFDLSKVHNELEKLMLYREETKEISREDVERLVPKSLEHNLFQMTEYVVQNQPEKSLHLYQDLLLQGEETIKINAILISQFRLLLQVKILADQHLPNKEIAAYLKVHPYRVQLAAKQASRYDFETLSAVYHQVVENDYKIKTGQMDKELLFELFLLKPHF